MTYTAQLQILKCVVNGMCYQVILWVLKFMITRKTSKCAGAKTAQLSKTQG